MTILDYIDEYGKYRFDKEPFNEVDNVILSSLSYLELKGIVPVSRLAKISLKDAATIYIKWLKDEKNKITAHKSALKILKKIYKTKRYKDLKLYNYKYIGDNNEQFCALTIDLDDKTSYISFEGTDELISGWKEDFYLACYDEVPSEVSALHYINGFTLINKNLILGGHSKGGHLAVYAGMKANRFVKKKIIKIYSNDGPGFRKKAYQSAEYKDTISKVKLIIPNYSFFGLLLRHDDYSVIKSSIKGIYAHDFLSWQVDDNKFKKVKLSKESILLSDAMAKWVESYEDKDRIMFVNSVFEIFDKLNINSVEELIKHKSLILKIIVDSHLPKKTEKMMREFIKILLSFVL